ncbi:MAG: hypothetical protein ACAH88_08415 [Roseimicrobium sp.]
MNLWLSNFGGLVAPFSIKHWPAHLVLLTGMLFATTAVADPPIVNKPSGAKVKTYSKPYTKPAGPQVNTEVHRPGRIVVVPKPPITTVKPPQVSGIATPFPDSSIKSYPTKVEVRPAQSPVGPGYPLTRFSHSGRVRSPFATQQPFNRNGSVQNFLGIKTPGSGFPSSNVPNTSAITSTKTVSSFTPLPKTVVPSHPSGVVIRSGHPVRPEKWQKVQDHCLTEWSSWHDKNQTTLNSIQGNRMKNWGTVSSKYHEPGWAKHFHGKDYKKWCGDVWNYRRDRCVEVWGQRKPYWNHVFDNDWWGACWWRSGPPKHVRHANETPWWWWNPCRFDRLSPFFGTGILTASVVYDPGATVLYDGSSYYVDGVVVDTAVAGRQQAIDLANPMVSEIPVPDPAPEGEDQTWMPLGVWALAQQQQGDPTMFVQLSVDKSGIVAGAYKNILTGDEQPIVGKVDLKTQRMAWHVGDATETVYETGLSSLENDVASVFIHFGTDATQTWLLVRLPSPELPPGPVKAPKVD